MTGYCEQIERHMGGTWVFRCYPGKLSRQQVENVFTRAFLLLCELENKLTDFRPSPFNHINTMAGKQAVVVDDETFALILRAIGYSQKSQGAFDISYASVGLIWREARALNRLPSLMELESRRGLIDYQRIELDKKKKSVYLPHEEMRIGLGGIGKGYAVDRIYAFFMDCGLKNFYINGAGDIRVHSAPDAPRAWRIGVRNPFSQDEGKNMAQLCLKNGSVATSGDYVNFIAHENQKWHHLINPDTAVPELDVTSATVIAENAEEADVSASIGILKGKAFGLEYLNQKDLRAFLVGRDGQVFLSNKAISQMDRDVRRSEQYVS